MMKKDATLEEKEAENVSLHLDDVATTADTTADDIDNAEFLSSTVAVAVPTTTTTRVISMEIVSNTTVVSTEIVSNKDNFLSNLVVVVAYDDDIDNANLHPIGTSSQKQQQYQFK